MSTSAHLRAMCISTKSSPNPASADPRPLHYSHATSTKAAPESQPRASYKSLSRPNSVYHCGGHIDLRSVLIREPPNSLDFSLLPPTRSSGPICTIGHRLDHHRRSANQSPGPGQYEIRLQEHRQTAVFGSEPREVEPSESNGKVSYLDVYSPDPVRPKSVAYSFYSRFGQGSGSVLSENYIPGPGHYDCDYYSKEKNVSTPSFVTTVSLNASTMVARKQSQPYYDLAEGDTSAEKAGNGGFQKFSMLGRFQGQKNRYRHYRLLRKPGVRQNSLVLQNARNARNEKSAEKLRKIVENKYRREFTLETAKATKERIEQVEETRRNAMAEAKRRRKINAGKKLYFEQVGKAWTGLLGVEGWMKILADKYMRRREVRKRTDKFMRILFVCFWAVGKFVRAAQARRLLKMKQIMKRIVMLKRGLWNVRRRLRAKKLVASYFANYAGSPILLIFIKLVTSRIRVIQKWYRRHYVKQRLLLALMNVQWSAIEFVVLRARRGEAEEETISIEERVTDSINKGQVSNVVPIQVRLRWLKEHLKELNKSYGNELSSYYARVKKLRQNAEHKHDIKQIECMLRGLPQSKFSFKPPPPPAYRIFVRRGEMIDLIKSALLNRLEWGVAEIKAKTNTGLSNRP